MNKRKSYKSGDIVIAWGQLVIKILAINDNDLIYWDYYVLVLHSRSTDRFFRLGSKQYIQDPYVTYKPNQKLAKLIYD